MFMPYGNPEESPDSANQNPQPHPQNLEFSQLHQNPQRQPLTQLNLEPPGQMVAVSPKPTWQPSRKVLVVGGMVTVAVLSISTWLLSQVQVLDSVINPYDAGIAQLREAEESVRLQCEDLLLHYDHQIPPDRVGLTQALLLRVAGEKSAAIEKLITNQNLFPRDQMLGDRQADEFVATERSKIATLTKVVTPALGAGATGELKVLDQDGVVIANIALSGEEVALAGLNRVQALDLSINRPPDNYSTATTDVIACQMALLDARITRLSAQTGIPDTEIRAVVQQFNEAALSGK